MFCAQTDEWYAIHRATNTRARVTHMQDKIEIISEGFSYFEKLKENAGGGAK